MVSGERIQKIQELSLDLWNDLEKEMHDAAILFMEKGYDVYFRHGGEGGLRRYTSIKVNEREAPDSAALNITCRYDELFIRIDRGSEHAIINDGILVEEVKNLPEKNLHLIRMINSSDKAATFKE